MLSWDKEAIVLPKKIHFGRRPLIRDIRTPGTGKRDSNSTAIRPPSTENAPSRTNCCSSSLVPEPSASPHALGKTSSRYQPQMHKTHTAWRNKCLGWATEQGVRAGRTRVLGGFAAPRARLFSRQRCRSAAASHDAALGPGTKRRRQAAKRNPGNTAVSSP